MSTDIGVIYIATGEKYVKMASMSANSLKAHCPDIPVHIFTECNIESYNCFDSSTKITDPHLRSKVDYMSESPFQRTLFLDADTRVCEDITSMFDLLDHYEFALAHDPGRGRQMKKYVGPVPKIFLPVNSGVILFKKTEPVMQFLESWKIAFHKEDIKRDQLTLRELLWLSDLKLWILTPEYNCRPKGYIKVLQSAKITPKILHLRDFKKEAGIPPKHNPMPLGRKIKHLIKHKIKNPIRRRLLGVPY